jgi:hypothetical protein
MTPAEGLIAKLLLSEHGYVVWYQVGADRWRLLVEVGGVDIDEEEYRALQTISGRAGRRPGRLHELSPPQTESSP